MTQDEAYLQDKIAELQAAGKALHVETSEPLSGEEKASLQRFKYQQLAAYFVFGIVLSAAPFIPAVDAPKQSTQIAISASIFVAYSTLMIFLIRRMNNVFNTSLKIVVKGIVTKKSVDNSGKTTHYGLTIGTEELTVPREVYHAYRVGDAIELHHYRDWGHRILQHKRLEAAGLQKLFSW